MTKWQIIVVVDDSNPTQKLVLDAVRNNITVFTSVTIQATA